jgi:ribosome-binding protein aMBF1 (putative translation factor)
MTVWVHRARKADLLAVAGTLATPAPPPKPLATTAPSTPAHDPRQLDLEAVINGMATTAETENQVMATTDRSPFGAIVREARNRRGWTSERLAKESELAASTIRNIEAGRFGASPAARARLIQALGLSEAI